MKILFIGDNIIRGSLGVNWVSQITRAFPEWEIENAGKNGECLIKISERLIEKLHTDNNFDVIVFQAGYNDILLPTFKTRDRWFKREYERQIQSGNEPSSPILFEQILRGTISSVKKLSKAKIIFPALGCINEHLIRHTNGKQITYNDILNRVAQDFECIFADIADKFDNELLLKETSDYLLNSYLNYSAFDRIRSVLSNPDKLSRERSLHLTTDGLHLNSNGAEIFRNEVERQLLLIRSSYKMYVSESSDLKPAKELPSLAY